MAEAVQSIRIYLQWAVANLTWTAAVDILLVAAIFYGILYLIRGTQAVHLLRGILLLVLIVVLVGNVFHLAAFSWLIRNTFSALLVAIPVIFQPELRRALERLGRAGWLLNRGGVHASLSYVIDSVSRAAQELSERRHGALIVLEGDAVLEDVIATGMPLDAVVSSDLLLTIFFPNSELHDGAAVIRGNRLVAARCILPLAEAATGDGRLGTRHLAAIGLTEQTDALVIVVSEETGIISLARNGRMIRNLDKGRLARLLYRWLQAGSRRGPTRVLRRDVEVEEEEVPLATSDSVALDEERGSVAGSAG